jgi:hypothetical protein
MRLRYGTPVVRASFDDPNLASCAGLEPVMRLAEACDLPGIVWEKVHLPTSIGSHPVGKVATIVAGMVAGADSIPKSSAAWYAEAIRRNGLVPAPPSPAPIGDDR